MERWRSRADEDFRQEIEAHIALEADRLIADGVPADAARDAARRIFGNVTTAAERYYESRRQVWLIDLGRDVRYGLRLLARHPARRQSSAGPRPATDRGRPPHRR